jgi:hypothetical protein
MDFFCYFENKWEFKLIKIDKKYIPDMLIYHTLCTKTEELNQIYEAHMNTFIYLL